jgi:hypothetical protein
MNKPVTLREIFELLSNKGVGVAVNGEHKTKKYPVELKEDQGKVVVQMLNGVEAPQRIKEAQLEVLSDIFSNDNYDVERIGTALHISNNRS